MAIPRRSSPSTWLFRPLALVLCITILLLVYFTAQNVGSGAKDRRREALFQSTQKARSLARTQLQHCTASVEDANSRVASAPEALQATETERNAIVQEIATTTHQMSDARRLLSACEQKLDGLKLRVTGTEASSVDGVLTALREKEESLRAAVAEVMAADPLTRNATHEEAMRLVRVLIWITTRLVTERREPEGLAVACSKYKIRERYAVVFDIGSTGNRIHVYKFISKDGANSNRALSVWDMTLESEVFEYNRVPMSEQRTPEAIIGALNTLFDTGVATIPAEMIPCTPLEFKATAGLRKAGAERAAATLQTIRAHYANASQLWLRGEQPARILEGREEGPLAWLTVNYLLGRFKSTSHSPTAAIIDLGGGSTQIVVEPPAASMPPSLTDEDKYAAVVNGRKVLAYQHSYEGLGLHEGTRELLMEVQGKCAGEVHHRHLYTLPPTDGYDGEGDDDDEMREIGAATDEGANEAVGAVDAAGGNRSEQEQEEEGGAHAAHTLHDPNVTAMRHFPCFATGYSDPIGIQNAAEGKEGATETMTTMATVNPNGGGGANFHDCVALVRDYVLDRVPDADCPSHDCGMRGMRQPSLAAFNGPIYAFSFIHDLMYEHRADKSTEEMTLAEMGSIGQSRCADLTLKRIADAEAAEAVERTSSLKPAYECLYYSYVFALLRYGYGIPEDRRLTIAKKINGFETAWTLGAALMSLS